jgi:hypothetical protein
MALFIDLMIVFFAFIAGESDREPVGPRYSMRHWFELAYGPRTAEAAGRWLAAMNGDTYHKNGSFHGIELATLTDRRDLQCQSFLRQDGYLRQLSLEHGRAPWTLLDSGYWELVDYVRATGGLGTRDAAEESGHGELAMASAGIDGGSEGDRSVSAG